MTRRNKIIIISATAVFLFDRLTKLLVLKGIKLGDSVPVVNGFFDLTHVRNTGAAFGVLSMARDSFRVPFFIVTSAAAIALLVYFIRKTPPERTLMLIALALIIGGALGNLIDRLMYGYVIDFIDWHAGALHWPAFNIADSGITVGVFLVGFEVFLKHG